MSIKHRFQLNVNLTLIFCLTDINPDFYLKLNQFSRQGRLRSVAEDFQVITVEFPKMRRLKFIKGLDKKLGAKSVLQY